MTENKKGRVWYMSPVEMRTALALVPHYIAFDESETRREEGIKVIEHSSYQKAVDVLKEISEEKNMFPNRHGLTRHERLIWHATETLKELGEVPNE